MIDKDLGFANCNVSTLHPTSHHLINLFVALYAFSIDDEKEPGFYRYFLKAKYFATQKASCENIKVLLILVIR